MSEYLVYYKSHHDNLSKQTCPADNNNVKIAIVCADNENQAEVRFIGYFGENIISIVKTEKL